MDRSKSIFFCQIGLLANRLDQRLDEQTAPRGVAFDLLFVHLGDGRIVDVFEAGFLSCDVLADLFDHGQMLAKGRQTRVGRILRVAHRRALGDHRAIDLVALGALEFELRERLDLPGLEHVDAEARLAQASSQGSGVTGGRFHADAPHPAPAQFVNDGAAAIRVIAAFLPVGAIIEADVERIFANVDSRHGGLNAGCGCAMMFHLR